MSKRTTELYKNYDWLYEEYVIKKRTLADIGKQFGRDRKSVTHFVKKFGIQTPDRTSYTRLNCSHCGSEFQKKSTYVKWRTRDGADRFFCSRECADAGHSDRMIGERNPNFNGCWHGGEISPEGREKIRQGVVRNIERLRANGELDKRMEAIHAGHKRYFSTPEGKKKRIECGIASVLAQAGKRETSIERIVREFLEETKIEHIAQHRLHHWVVDFLLPDYNVVIEVNGDYWHANPTRFPNPSPKQLHRIERDNAKKVELEADGYTVVFLWETDIRTDFDSCIAQIRDAIAGAYLTSIEATA